MNDEANPSGKSRNKTKSEKGKSPAKKEREQVASGRPEPVNVQRSQGLFSSGQRSRISRYFSFFLLVAIIIFLAFLFYEVMAMFMVPLFLSALLVCIFRPLHQWILEKVKGRDKLAAGLTTASVLLAVLVPLATIFALAAAEGQQVIRQFNETRITEGVRQIRSNLNLDMPSAGSIRFIESQLVDLLNHSRIDEVQNQHQVALFEIESEARQLSVELDRRWPTESDSNDIIPADSWDKFTLKLQEAKSLHEDMNFDLDDKTSRENARQELRVYQTTLREAADEYAAFKTELLGGTSRAWLTELVNPTDEQFSVYASRAVDEVRNKIVELGGKGISFIGKLGVGTVIMIIGFYFFLLDGPGMIESFKGLSPMDDDHEQELVSEFGRVSRAVVVATLLSALVQGLLAGIGFYFAGLESVIFLTVLSAVLAMVPFVGAAAVWIPCSLYLYFFENNLVAAIGLAIYGAAVVSMADNIIKPYILHGQSNLHPLLALLSVIGGVAVLGPIGILVGPMVVAFLQTLLKILRREMQEFDQSASTHAPGAH